MLQVFFGSSCRAGVMDRGCEKQSARTRDSEVLKRSFSAEHLSEMEPGVITYIVAELPYSIF